MDNKTFCFEEVEILSLNGQKMDVSGIKTEFCTKLWIQGDTIVKHQLGKKLWEAKEPVELTEEEYKVLRDEFEGTPSYLIRTALLEKLNK